MSDSWQTEHARPHLARLDAALRTVDHDLARIEQWARLILDRIDRGGKVLIAGNGGSAAHAQHLSAELLGRYRTERRPLPAIALHADTSTVTAVANDYGITEMFRRQVVAHSGPNDVVVLFSTSGGSPNVLAAADAAHALGACTLALTGRGPNPLAERCDDAITVDAESTATVQECHQVIVHLLCDAIDDLLLQAAVDELVRTAP
jgi:D-sedoheptulose 7-phosphate isomerase